MDWMHQSVFINGMSGMGIGPPSLLGLIPLLVWTLLWSGWALWLAARRGEFWWFVVLLVVNTFGLLEIFYIFVIAKQEDAPASEKERTSII